MKIGLIDVDGHAKKKKWGATIYPNLALCKIARYHKEQGDEVEWAQPLFGHYDRIYKSDPSDKSDPKTNKNAESNHPLLRLR